MPEGTHEDVVLFFMDNNEKFIKNILLFLQKFKKKKKIILGMLIALLGSIFV